MSDLKVLIVDDEPGIRSGISRILRNYRVGYPFLEEDFGFTLTEAETGEIALEILEKQEIDIVLLDNKLPGIEGIDVLEQINKRNYDTAVMMITSYASLELAVTATKRGAYNFVPKPFTPEELRGAIESITKHLFLKRMTKKMSETARQIRFQFLSVLSHELKSPINAIEGYLKIMQEKQAGTSIDDYMHMINRSIERITGMRSLIMDMLDLTRIENGTKSRNLKEVDIIECTKMAISSMEPMAIQKNIKILTDFPASLLLTADSNEVEIIANNLISNAIKYNRDNGTVTISIFTDKTNLNIIVEDTGIGINAEEQEFLFQEFMRIKNKKTQNISGSGLGLSIVKKIIELYNGTITVESQPDVGTKFLVKIPFKAQPV
ncbi:MAG: response regulator [Bacteroidia bacterium]|nr:response regulator [Bacteroidia bacterium]